MNEQLAIDGRSEPVDVTLTSRQAEALRIVREHGTIASDELGAELHAWQGSHPVGQRCAWCQAAGVEVGRALRRKGLVTYRHRAGWVAPGYQTRPADSNESSQLDVGDPWPEGF